MANELSTAYLRMGMHMEMAERSITIRDDFRGGSITLSVFAIEPIPLF